MIYWKNKALPLILALAITCSSTLFSGCQTTGNKIFELHTLAEEHLTTSYSLKEHNMVLAYDHYLIALSYIEELLNEYPQSNLTQELRAQEKKILDLTLEEFFDFQVFFAQDVFIDKIAIIADEWQQWLGSLTVLIVSQPQLHAFYNRVDDLQDTLSLTTAKVMDFNLIDMLTPEQKLFYKLYLVHHYIRIDLDLARLYIDQAREMLDILATPQQQLIVSKDLFSDMLYLEQKDQAIELLDFMTPLLLNLKDQQFDMGQIYMVYDDLIESLLTYDMHEPSIVLARTIANQNERYEKLNKTVLYFIEKLMLDQAVELAKELDGGHLTNFKDARLYDIAIIYAEKGMKKEAEIILQHTSDYYVHVLYHLDWAYHYQQHNLPDDAARHLTKAYDFFNRSQFLNEEQKNVYLWSIMQQCVDLGKNDMLVQIIIDRDEPSTTLEALYLVAEDRVEKGIYEIPQKFIPYFDEKEWEEAIQRVLELRDLAG